MKLRSFLSILIGSILLHSPALADTERVVKQKYAQYPVLIKIARCESGFRQFDGDGKPLKNPNSSATGVMQIVASIHAREAFQKGFNIRTTQGNLEYALFLYKQQGTEPWEASRKCWRNA